MFLMSTTTNSQPSQVLVSPTNVKPQCCGIEKQVPLSIPLLFGKTDARKNFVRHSELLASRNPSIIKRGCVWILTFLRPNYSGSFNSTQTFYAKRGQESWHLAL